MAEKKIISMISVKDEEKEKSDKKKRAEEFLKTVNSKLKKSEHETWMIHDHDHLYDDHK